MRGGLNGDELLVLQFEERWWRNAPRRRGGAKDVQIRRLFDGMDPVRYHQILNALIDRPEAEELHPLLVHRLRRIRDAGRRRAS